MPTYEQRLITSLRRFLLAQDPHIGEGDRHITIKDVYLQPESDEELVVITFQEKKRPDCLFGFCTTAYEDLTQRGTLDNPDAWQHDPALVWADMIVAQFTEHIVAANMGLPKDCRSDTITWITSLTPLNSQQPPLRPTHVVTNFLLRADEKEERILIVQRSQKVGSYHGRWAGISGFVEPDVTPDEQAYTEIREETGLQHDQVRMLRRGEVVEYSDAELGRHFYIHPFLFAVLTPERVQTDWEAVNMRWIAPTDLHSYETVPKLQEVYDAAIHGEILA